MKGVMRWLLALAAHGLLWFGLVTSTVVLALRWIDPPTSSFILLSSAEAAVTGPDWVPRSAVSPWLHVAVIAAEDQKFPYHWGFDFVQIRGALVEALEGTRIRGASTISQQLAKNLFLWPGRDWLRKALEAYFALLLEGLLPKQRILELYLNLAEFGPQVFGAQAAAALYFSRRAADLTRRQAGLMAAALPSPRRHNLASPDPQLVARARHIQTQIDALGGTAYLDNLATP